MDETRIAAFVEYVLRPLSEDWKLILEQLKSLNIGITHDTIKSIMWCVGAWHLCSEIIRATCYIIITIVICQTIIAVL